MANKAVIGAVALGVGLHQVNEWWKDRNAEKELEERLQLEQDRLDAHLHRQEQGNKKKKKQNKTKKSKDQSETALLYQNIQTIVEQKLKETIQSAGRLQTMKAGSFDSLKLPLLGSEPRQQDLMLAVALAFSDDEAIDSFFKHRLGTPLVTLNRSMVQKIICHINSKLAYIDSEYIHSEMYGELLNRCVRISFLDPRVKNMQSVVIPCAFSRNGAKMVQRYGFFLTPLAHFEQGLKSAKRRGKHSMTFHWHGMGGYVKDGSAAVITNFRPYSNTSLKPTPFHVPIVQGNNGEEYLNFELATVPARQKQKLQRHNPQLELLLNDYALMLSCEMHKIAASRLENLLSHLGSRQELSLQHIAVHSGYDGTLLEAIEDADKHIIEHNHKSLAVTLHSTLLACVPPAKNQLGSLLQSEIRDFVKNYIRLLQLSYCKTPILGTKAPSHYVPKKSVAMEAKQWSIWVSDETMFHGTKRLLEKSERDKIDQARRVIKPKLSSVFLLGSVLFSLITWLVYIIVHQIVVLSFPYHTMGIEQMTSLAATAPFAYWTMQNLLQLLKSPLRLEQSDFAVTSFITLEALTDAIVRHASIRLGMPATFDAELEALANSCRKQHEEWISRIAINEFQRARRRKKIGYSNYLQLMSALQETVYKTKDEGGKPVSKPYAPKPPSVPEFFVGEMKVSEITQSYETNRGSGQPGSNAASVSSEKISKRTRNDYDMPETFAEASSILAPLVCQDEDDDGPQSQLSMLKSVKTLAEESLMVSVGDRVTVDLPDAGAEELPPVFSAIGSATALSSHLRAFKSMNASIVSCHPGHCFVHFDGKSEAFPIPVPLSWLSPIDETRVNNLLCNVFGNKHALDDEATMYLTDGKRRKGKAADKDGERRTSKTEIEQYRPTSLAEALDQGHWSLVRQKKHYIYKRILVLPSHANDGQGGSLTQTVAFAKTASDHRAEKNAMSTLRKKEDERQDLSATIFLAEEKRE